MKGSLLLYNLYSNNVTICSNFLNCLIFFYQSKQLTDYIYTDIYCKLSKCIGQTQLSLKRHISIAVQDKRMVTMDHL